MRSEGILLLLIVIVVIIILEWIIGKAIGKKISHGSGMILEIIGILFGFTFIAGIACIVYSQKNRSSATIGINLNPSSHQNDIYNSNSKNSNLDNDMKVCPYCAEMIKKQAVICRYCGKEI